MKLTDQRVSIVETPGTQIPLIECAARTCHNSRDKITPNSADEFIRRLIRQGHEAPLEFGHMTVEILTSRDVLAELTRHRLASYCVESQRYVNYGKSDGVTFVVPWWWVDARTEITSKTEHLYHASRVWEQQMQDAEDAYLMMIHGYGLVPQDARTVLPNSTACTLMMSANLREWRSIFQLRCDSPAYPPMGQLMRSLLTQADDAAPCVFDDLKEKFL